MFGFQQAWLSMVKTDFLFVFPAMTYFFQMICKYLIKCHQHTKSAEPEGRYYSVTYRNESIKPLGK